MCLAVGCVIYFLALLQSDSAEVVGVSGLKHFATRYLSPFFIQRDGFVEGFVAFLVSAASE